jgi:hypothetical protein
VWLYVGMENNTPNANRPYLNHDLPPRTFGAGYQEALRDVLAAWDDMGAEAARDYINDNLAK